MLDKKRLKLCKQSETMKTAYMEGNLGRRGKRKGKHFANIHVYNIMQENKVEVKGREGAWSDGKSS